VGVKRRIVGGLLAARHANGGKALTSVIKRLTVAFALVAGLIVASSSSAQASGPITISSTNFFTLKDGGHRIGTLMQWYNPNATG
jgi:hypothetical protein